MVSGEGKIDGRQGRELALDTLAGASGLHASAHSYWKHFASCRSRVNRPVGYMSLGSAFSLFSDLGHTLRDSVSLFPSLVTRNSLEIVLIEHKMGKHFIFYLDKMGF